MTFPWMSLVLGLVAAAANIAGGWVVARGPWHPLYLRYFIALGSGFMLAASLLEMLPESYALVGEQAAIWMLGGYLLIHFGEETHAEQVADTSRTRTVLFGLMIHTFVDGVSIASGFLISNFLGWVVFLAVFLHKMPEGFAVSSIMIASGQSKRTAVIS